MKIIIAAALAAASLSACVTAPTDPAELAAWNAEKTARTEARRPAPGSVVANPPANPEAFEDLKAEYPPVIIGDGY